MGSNRGLVVVRTASSLKRQTMLLLAVLLLTVAPVGGQVGEANPPDAPEGFQGWAVNNGDSIFLAWENSGTGITYNLYRNGTLIEEGLTGTWYLDVDPPWLSAYTLTAVNVHGESLPAGPVVMDNTKACIILDWNFFPYVFPSPSACQAVVTGTVWWIITKIP